MILDWSCSWSWSRVESNRAYTYRIGIPICTLRMVFLLFGLPCRMLLCYIIQIMLLYANKFMS